MSLPVAIDFDAIRASLVAIVQDACGLDQNHVIMLEPETVVAPRPSLPYISIKVTTAAAKMGDDIMMPVAGGNAGLFLYSGQRMCSVAFDAYATSHEQAYAYLHVLMSRFDQEPTQDALAVAGLALWDCSSVVDQSGLLSTGTEGRSHMDCEFGLVSNMVVDLGVIETIPIRGAFSVGDSQPILVNTLSSIKGA